MSAINTLTGSFNAPSTTPNGFSSLSSAEFVRIMFAELTNQDPLAPSDSQALLNQLSSLRSIQSDLDMMERLGRLVNQNEFAAASGLIGNLVSGITTDNRRVTDLVVSVSMTRDGPVLNMFDGARVLFRNVDQIFGPLVFEDEPPKDDPPKDDDDDDGKIDVDNFDVDNDGQHIDGGHDLMDNDKSKRRR